MGLLTSHESRLIYALLLNALVLWSAWRVARRTNEDLLDAAGDACLLFYLVQYVSVCVPGLVGALHPLTIGAVAVLVSAAMGVVGLWRARSLQDLPIAMGRLSDRVALVASALFVVGYLFALVLHQRDVPVMSNDAITYHFSAAVQWLQTGRLGLYEAWFYNPANSYSPLAGSTFIAWLIAPLGNDVIARFVQVGPVLMLFVAMLNLCRRVGASVAIAALIAAATVLARPLVSQTILAKDDLFVAAFFVLAVDALSRERLESRFGAWRTGVAIGLLLATKYTVLLSMPIFVLMLGRGWNWRRIGVIVACVLILAGPWYWRNVVLTGNPLYPTFGLLSVGRSDLLATPRGVWNVFTSGYYAVPVLLACVLIVGWVAGAVVAGWDLWRDRLKRTCIFGPMIGVGLFAALAPYGEMRFAYPSVALMFAAMAIALARLPRSAAMAIALALVHLAAATGFHFYMSIHFIVFGAVFAAVGVGLVLLHHRGVNIHPLAGAAAALIAIAGTLYGYVYWRAYVRDLEVNTLAAWSDATVYGKMGEVWSFVRNELPPGAPIAYANTYFTYPLMGFAYDHRVVHAPTRRGLERFVDMPRIEQRIIGEQIVANVVDMLRQNPDREQWLRRLRATGAQYLVVGRHLKETSTPTPPPEITFAAEDPRMFEILFENEAGIVYQIRP